MPTTQLQFRRGNTAQTSVFTGAIGEVTVDTDRKTLTVHDGVTVGGTYVATNIQLTSAYGKANAANNLAQAGFDQANLAFNKANVANTIAQSSYDFGNTVNTYAFSAYSTANSAQANTVITQGVDSTQNTWISSNAVFSQSAFTKANSANVLAQAAFDQGNNNTTILTSAYNFANSVNTYAYSSNVYLSGLVTTANTDMKAYVDQANTGMASYVTASISTSNTAMKAYVDQANTGMASYVVASNTAMKAYVDQANTGLKSYGDATYFAKAGGTISGAVTISGNLIVQGTTFSSNSTTFEVNDPLILLGVGNYYSDTRDIGFAAHYNDGTNAHSGLIRDYATKEYYFFKGYTPEIDANNNVDITHASFQKANIQTDKVTSQFLVANSATLGGIDVITYTTAAFDKANSAASNTVITQGVDSTQNTNITTATNLAQGAFTSANTRANSFSGTTGSATPSGGSITFTSTNGITISGASSTLTINSPQDLQSTASPTFKSISFANTATGNRSVVQSTTTTTSQTAIDTWSTSTYRTAKYIISMSSGAYYHSIELLLIHNGSSIELTQYAEIYIGASLATFDASITSGILSLLVTPATSSSITYNILRDNIGV